METIKSVETIRGKKRITFDSGWQVWLGKYEDPGFPLTEGTVIGRGSFQEYLRLHQYPAALDRAVRMLAMRPCSRKEIEQRLILAKFDPEVIELVLFKLEKENLLNDRDFAEQWVQSRSLKYGASRIRRELRIKGIDEDTASEMLDSLPDDTQLQHAAAFAAKKIRSLRSSDDPAKIRHRVAASLVRRGYSWDIALQAYEEALRQDE